MAITDCCQELQQCKCQTVTGPTTTAKPSNDFLMDKRVGQSTQYVLTMQEKSRAQILRTNGEHIFIPV